MLKTCNIYLLIAIVILLLSSCEKEDNKLDFPGKLFRPAKFQSSVNTNEVTFSWVPIKGANYLLEISKDSLLFTNDVQAFTIEGASEFLVENLWSSTLYSARIKSVSIDPEIQDSEYKQLIFVTGTENIFSMIEPGDLGSDHVLLKWDAEKAVSHIVVVNASGNEITLPIATGEMSVGQKNIEGLSSDSSYTFKIYNFEMLRGTITVTTKSTN